MKYNHDKGLRVIFRLEDKYFSIHSLFVEAMEVIESVRKVPQSPVHLRGIIELRGKVIPILDLRNILGMKPLTLSIKTIHDQLIQYKVEHEKIENQLLVENLDSIEKINSCSLNDFIKNFKSDNIFFQEAIAELRFPHSKLHLVIENYFIEKKAGNKFKSDTLFQQLKTKEFPRFKNKLDETINIINSKKNEIYIVLGYDGRLLGLTVDSIYAVDEVLDIDKQKAGIYDFFSTSAKNLIESVGRNKKIDGLIINMSVLEIFKSFKFDAHQIPHNITE